MLHEEQLEMSYGEKKLMAYLESLTKINLNKALISQAPNSMEPIDWSLLKVSMTFPSIYQCIYLFGSRLGPRL